MLLYQGVFLLGIFVESLRTLPVIKHWKRIALIAIIAVVGGLLPGKREHAYDLHAHLWIIGMYYTLILFFAYTQELLPKLSEFDLILHAISIWTLTSFGITASGFEQYAPYINGMSAIMLLYVFLPLPTNTFVEVLLYAWSIILAICIMVVQYWWFLSYPFYREPTFQSMFTMITSGMAGFILFRNVTILVELVPIPGKHQTFRERLNEVKKYAHLIHNKFDDRQLSPIPAIIITECLVGGIVVNEYYHLFPTASVILILLIVAQYVQGIRGFYLLPASNKPLPQ